jgi:hypothetical protein
MTLGADSSWDEPIPRVARGGPTGLAPAQLGLLAWSARRPPCATFNFGFSAVVEGNLEVDALCRAVRDLVARHEVLRTRYVAAEPNPFQILDEPPAAPTRISDLRHLAREQANEEAKRLFIADVSRPFELAKEHSARWTLARVQDDVSRLIVTTHQISCGPMEVATIVIPELIALYDAYAAGSVPSLPDVPLQFIDYSAWLNAWLLAGGAPLVERWKQRFADARPLELPTSRPRGSPVSLEAETVHFDLAKNVVEPLDVLCRARRVPPAAAFIAALAASLARRAGQSDTVIGLLADTHTVRPELATMIGRFLNPVPCRIDLRGDPTGIELLSRTRASLIESHRHRIVPTELALGHASPLDGPLMRVVTNVISQPPAGSPSFRGTKTTFDWHQTDESKNELVLSIHREAPDLWRGYLRAARSIYDRAAVSSMTTGFVRSITALVLQPEARHALAEASMAQ